MSWQDALINPFMTIAADDAPVADLPQDSTVRFELDADAFMADIEPPPLFLRDCERAIEELLRSAGQAA